MAVSQLPSRELSPTIAAQREEIKSNARYLKEQEALIKTTIDIGNNQILQLTAEADDILRHIVEARGVLILLNSQIDNKRFELLNL